MRYFVIARATKQSKVLLSNAADMAHNSFVKLKSLSAVFALCFLPRAACGFFANLPDPGWSHYWNLATGLLKYGALGYEGESISSIEPGYPFFLAAARWLFHENYAAVLLLQTAAASLGGVYLFLLTRLLTSDPKASWAAAILFAFYPYLMGQAVMIIEVPLFMTLLIMACYYFLKIKNSKDAALCGLVFAATLWTRMMISPALFAAVLILLSRKQFKHFLILSGVLFVCLAPHFARNYFIDGSLVPPRSGWNLLQGSNPYAGKVIPHYNPDLMDVYVSKVLAERPDLEESSDVHAVDEFYTAKAWEFMKAHPAEALKVKLLNALYLFHPRIVPFYSMDENTVLNLKGENEIEVLNAPSRGWFVETSHVLYYGFILLTSFIGIYLRRKDWRTDLIFYFVILNFTLVYAYHWPATRLRAPMDFILIFYSATFLSRMHALKSDALFSLLQRPAKY